MAETPFMMSRRALCVSMGAVLLLGCPKEGMAGPSKRMAVTIKVVDPSGEPVPTASVRHPEERDRHGVNMATGEYTTDALFMEDGREVLFEKGMSLTYEVSAPGFQNTPAQFTLRRRANTFVVVLQPLELDDLDVDEGPSIQLQQDNPLDGR